MEKVIMAAPRYDVKTIWLHWLTAALVIALWCLGQTIDWFPHGAPRVFARSAHISIGALLAGVFVYRLWWRATAGARLPAAGTGGLKVLARAMHLALYVCIFATVALGLANAWVRGDNLFYLYKISPFDANNKALRESVENYHAYAANFLLIMAGMHAAAGLFHHYLLKVDVLGRMLPALGRNARAIP